MPIEKCKIWLKNVWSRGIRDFYSIYSSSPYVYIGAITPSTVYYFILAMCHHSTATFIAVNYVPWSRLEKYTHRMHALRYNRRVVMLSLLYTYVVYTAPVTNYFVHEYNRKTQYAVYADDCKIFSRIYSSKYYVIIVHKSVHSPRDVANRVAWEND